MGSFGATGMNKPSWLPDPLQYSDFNGNWERFIEAVYRIFEGDFKESRPSYNERSLTFDSRIEQGKEVAFWHIVSSIDPNTKDRVPDLRRCERIPWPRPIIEHPDDDVLMVWKNKRGRDTRVLLWLEKLDYLVVLSEKSRAVIIVTAYCTDRRHTRAKLVKDRDRYLKMQKPPGGAT